MFCVTTTLLSQGLYVEQQQQHKAVSVRSDWNWSVGPPSAKCQSITQLVCGLTEMCYTMLASSVDSVSESVSFSLKHKKMSQLEFSFADANRHMTAQSFIDIPQFLKQFAVALPPLLVDWIRVKYDQADYDESYGGSRNQQLQGQVHFRRLRAASTDVACKAK